MSRTPDLADKRFGQALLAVSLVVLISVAAHSFLGSAAGRNLLAGAPQTGNVSEPVVLDTEGEDILVLPLGAIRLDPRGVFLLAADLGPGGEVVFVGLNRQTGTRVQFRCPSRRWRSECHRVLDATALPDTLYFRVVFKGRGELDLHEFRIARLSNAHLWLPRVVRALIWLAPLAFLVAYRRRLRRALFEPRVVDDVAFALLVLALCLQVFHAGKVQQLLDSRYVTAVSHSLIRGQGVSLPLDLAPSPRDRTYQIDRVAGRLVPHYSPIPAVLDAPVVAAYEWLGLSPARPNGGWDRGREVRILRFSATLVSALLCVVLYRIARGYLNPAFSIGLTLAFAFGTQILSTLSRPYWSHTWSTMLAASAVLLLVSPTHRQSLWATAAAASLASLSVFCRPQTLWTVLSICAGLALTRSWRRLGVFAVVGTLWAVFGVGLSLSIYDSALPSYFFSDQVSAGRIASPSVNSYWYATGTLGALLSPARGLFIYVPIYLWILHGVLRGWNALSSRAWTIAALGAIVGHAWLIVWTGTWPGGQSYGARQFSDVLVWFFLLAVFAVEALIRRWPALGRRQRWAYTLTFVALLSFSVFVNARGAYSRATWHWNAFDRPPRWAIEGRNPPLPQPWVWNWRYPQFMAGLLPLDGREGTH